MLISFLSFIFLNNNIRGRKMCTTDERVVTEKYANTNVSSLAVPPCYLFHERTVQRYGKKTVHVNICELTAL